MPPKSPKTPAKPKATRVRLNDPPKPEPMPDDRWPERAKITEAFVRKLELPPKGRTVYILDADLPGFKLRLTSGGASFVAERRVGRGKGGIQRRVTIGRVKTDSVAHAREQARQTIAKLASGQDVIAERRQHQAERVRQGVTLADLRDRYIAASKLKPTTKNNYQFALKHYEAWHDRPLSDLTQSVIAAEHRRIAKKSESMAANSGRVLAALLSYAVEEGLVETNAAQLALGARRGRRGKRHATIYKGKVRRRALMESQLPAVLNWLEKQRTEGSPHMQCCADLAELLLMYGLRKGEATRMDWANVNLGAGYFTIPETKTDRPLTLPITTQARKLFDRRKAVADEHGSQWVFPSLSAKRRTASGHIHNIARFFELLNDACGTKTMPHDFRKVFGSIGGKFITASVKRAVINHAATRTGDVHADHYEHIEPEDMKEPLQRWNAFLESCKQ